jgi:hypothetical protein
MASAMPCPLIAPLPGLLAIVAGDVFRCFGVVIGAARAIGISAGGYMGKEEVLTVAVLIDPVIRDLRGARKYGRIVIVAVQASDLIGNITVFINIYIEKLAGADGTEFVIVVIVVVILFLFIPQSILR